MDRRNNFDLVRIAAALQVAFLHSCEHLQVPPGPVGGFLALFPGVPVFFFMSGLMVTASAMRRPLPDYAAARTRRVVPALWLAFVLALLILVAFGQIGAAEVGAPVFWAWVASQLTVFQVFNPEMFRDFGVGVVNGSLWTIPIEVAFYCLLPMLLWACGRDRRVLTVVLAAGAAISFPIGYLVQHAPETMLVKIVEVTLIAHFWSFALGALAYLHLDRIRSVLPRLHWVAPLLAYVAFAYGAQSLLPGMAGSAIASLMLCAAVLWAGMGAPCVVGILRDSDISYGVYVYHMLVINGILALGVSGTGAVAAVLGLSIGAAWLSWHYLERPILRGRAKRLELAT